MTDHRDYATHPMTDTREPRAEAKAMSGCQHPPEFRRPIPGYRSNDPNEWECTLCGTWQVKQPRPSSVRRDARLASEAR